MVGHTGFIGSHLIPELVSKKYKITGISRNIQKNNIKQIKKDILNIESSDIEKNSIVIHLAALTDVNYCQKNPVECFKVNVNGTQKILEIARKKECKLIYASTSHVYGIPTKLPIRENHSRNASSIYSASKIGGEICCESYAHSYDMDISIMRLFSVYGPRGPDNLVTSKIIKQLLSHNTIKMGNLFPKRDFVYITDVIKSIDVVLKNLSGLQIYNIGTGRSLSINEICNILKKLSKKNISILSLKSLSRRNEILDMVADSSRIKQLGWKPTVTILQGLKMTLDWYMWQQLKSNQKA